MKLDSISLIDDVWLHIRPVHGPKISCPARPGPLTIRPGLARPVIPVQFVGPARLGPFTYRPGPARSYEERTFVSGEI